MQDPDCLFCKIAAGEIPSERVYEDEHVIAFLDINPVAPGHTLLIPRDHCVTAFDTPAPVLAAIACVVPRVARAVMTAVGAEGFNAFQCNGPCAGQEVMHSHLHIIPRNPDDGVTFHWKPGTYAEGEMAQLGAKIRGTMAD